MGMERKGPAPVSLKNCLFLWIGLQLEGAAEYMPPGLLGYVKQFSQWVGDFR